MLQTLGPNYDIDPDELLRTAHKLPNWTELNK